MGITQRAIESRRNAGLKKEKRGASEREGKREWGHVTREGAFKGWQLGGLFELEEGGLSKKRTAGRGWGSGQNRFT